MIKQQFIKKMKKRLYVFAGICLLFLLWMFLTFWRIAESDISFSVLTFSHGKENLVDWKYSELLAKDKIRVRFNAEENNLGIVSIRFNTFNKVSKDAIIFRLKEEGKERWHYENKYNVNQFSHKKLYPFGFPKIVHSSGNIYIFEVESVNGKQGNSVALSDNYPIFTTHYQFPRDKITSSTASIFDFFWKKTLRSFEQQDIVFSSLIYLTPLFFFIVLLFKNHFLSNKLSFAYLLFLILIDIFIISQSLTSVHLIITVILLLTLKYKYVSEKVIPLALFLLTFSAGLSLFSLGQVADKASIWAYIFMTIGIGQSIIAFKNE